MTREQNSSQARPIIERKVPAEIKRPPFAKKARKPMTGEQLRSIRDKMGLVQRQFADLTNIPLNTVSELETNRLSISEYRKRTVILVYHHYKTTGDLVHIEEITQNMLEDI